jgi:hypothetical protein
MADIYIPKGDKGYPLSFAIKDSDGDEYSLVGFTIKLKVWKHGQPETLLVDGTCETDDEDAGICHYNIASGDFNSVGVFKAELELTKTGNIESTQSFELEVTESG